MKKTCPCRVNFLKELRIVFCNTTVTGVSDFIYFIGLFNRDHAYSWALLYQNTPYKYARISNNNYFLSAVPRQVT